MRLARDLPEFLAALEKTGELRRVPVEVDPELEVTEIVTRVLAEEGPALLFEKVKGSPYPLAINLFGSERRLELALGRPPAAIGAELSGALERLNPPTLRGIWQNRSLLRRLLKARVKRASFAPCQEVIEEPDLTRLPILKCWPEDGGRFITYPLVITTAPGRSERNLGLYRMHVHSPSETGMHWQIQKGGGFHHHEAERRQEALEVAVALGADPVLLFAAMCPLPEGMDEISMSGFLRGRPARLVRGVATGLWVPGNAEFVLEGEVPPGVRKLEGPFGDHYGHYSHAAEFPVFRIRKLTRKRQPVYVAALAGKPPQEDMYLGNAVQELFSPLLKIAHPEIRDLWSFYEAGFHPLLAVSMESRYRKEGVKTALGLLGEGQLSLTKCLVVVNETVSPRSFGGLLRAVRENFKPSRDFILLPGTSMDTLDFTGPSLNLGSKMVIDATGDLGPFPPPGRVPAALPDPAAGGLPVSEYACLEDCLLVVKVPPERNGDGRLVLQSLLHRPEFSCLKLIAAASDDVDLEDEVSLLWGLFTRFDPAQDILFRDASLRGACPVYDGPLGIDATWKEGYPRPVTMDPEIQDRVTRRWDELFP